MIKILKIFFLKNEKIFKSFLKMKYNRLLLFIYLKEFRRLYHHSATAHSAKGGLQQAPNTIAPEKTSAHRSKKRRGNDKNKEN